MRTKIYNILFICLVWMILGSCEEFLTENPNGQLSSESAFTEESDVLSSVNALYRKVRDASNASGNFAPVISGDDLCTHPASNKQRWRQFDQFDVFASNDAVNSSSTTGCWTPYWQIIQCANFIINGVESTPDASEDDIYFAKRQAQYWRAYAYFYLVRNWGPIPLVLDETIDYDAELSSVEVIYELILSDLEEAANLPVSYSETPWAQNGRNVAICRPAVEATLGYVYMTMAGWPLELGTEYYEKAATELKKVIDGVDDGTYNYELYDDYFDIHSKEHNYDHKEAIAAIYYSCAYGGGDDSYARRGGKVDMPAECGAWNDTRAEIGFWVKFPEGERKNATYGEVLYWSDNDEVVEWWDSRLTNRQPYFRKSAYTTYGNSAEYDITQSYGSQCDGWQDQISILVRLAEVYCWYAEAVGRSGQTSSKAFEVLNKVINRADSSEDLPLTGSESADELAERAYDEHGWEIAGWYWGSIGARRYDQLRMDRLQDHFETRVANDSMEVSPGVWLTEPIPVEGTWNELMNYAPYPEADVILNGNYDNTGRVQ